MLRRLALLLPLAVLACDLAPSQAPARAQQAVPAFPPPSRPVAAIVSDRWSDEGSREAKGEADTVIRLSGLRPGMTAADIGAGEGYYTVKLSKAVGPQGEVIAQDIVPRVAQALDRRVRRLRLANVRVLIGGPDDPHLPPGAVDRAYLIHMYHEIEQPYALMWRLHDALKPGARVAIVDSNRPTHQHGTPPALLRCELEAVGYAQVGFHDLAEAGVYLALFEPRPDRPAPGAIRPCPAA
jgi:predicted methyltransferase